MKPGTGPETQTDATKQTLLGLSKLQLITLPLAGQNLLSNAAWGF